MTLSSSSEAITATSPVAARAPFRISFCDAARVRPSQLKNEKFGHMIHPVSLSTQHLDSVHLGNTASANL